VFLFLQIQFKIKLYVKVKSEERVVGFFRWWPSDRKRGDFTCLKKVSPILIPAAYYEGIKNGKKSTIIREQGKP
jgi:hypothetical protein